MVVGLFKFRFNKSRFVKLFLVASIMAASAPSPEISAIWPFAKVHKKVESSFISKAFGGIFAVSIFAACAFGVYKFFLSDLFEQNSATTKNKPELNKSAPKKSVEPRPVIQVKKPSWQVAPAKNKPELNKNDIKSNVQMLNLQAFADRCDKLPKYAEASRKGYKNKALTKDEFVYVAQEFMRVVGQSFFANNNNWVGAVGNVYKDFNILSEAAFGNKKNIEIFPEDALFVEKLDLPQDAAACLHADIHSDVHSVIAYMRDLLAKGIIDNNFRIIKDNFCIAFLGDYTDRGFYGAEVWYTIMRLKIENPEKVILIRGNHEDLDQNNGEGGFGGELRAKFGFSGEYINYLLTKLYNCLPVAVFAGSQVGAKFDCALLCHGGLEPSFDSSALLQRAFNPGECFFARLNEAGAGFQWNDFNSRENIKTKFDARRGYKFDLNDVKKIIAKYSSDKYGYKVKFIFRGHQHNGNMINDMIKGHGICNVQAPNQWDGKACSIKLDENYPVWTLNVSPDSVYGESGNYRFDNYSVLKFPGKNVDWSLEPHKLDIAN